MKKYRFFYHYFRQKKKMSVHFKGVCNIVDHVSCHVPCETHYRDKQPFLVMRGYAEKVEMNGGEAIIK